MPSDLTEECPWDGSRGAIDALVDIPGDVDQRGTAATTLREEGDLRGGIDQLEFQIGNAHGRDDTSKFEEQIGPFL